MLERPRVKSHITYHNEPGGLRAQTWLPDFWGFKLALPITGCVILSKLLNLSGPQFLHLENGVNNSFPAKSCWEMGCISRYKVIVPGK